MQRLVSFAVFVTLISMWLSEGAIAAESPGRITGIGGIFVVSKNPKALTAWYRDVLGISLQPWGGATFRYDRIGHPPVALWDAFPRGTSEFAHSRRDFMLNFAVDDLDAFLSRLKAKRVPILKRETDPYGKYASILDPDGTKIELWQPTRR